VKAAGVGAGARRRGESSWTSEPLCTSEDLRAGRRGSRSNVGSRRDQQIVTDGLGATAAGGPLALRFLTLFRDPVLYRPTNLQRNRRGRPLLNPTQHGELFRLEKNLKARSR
jgi:hypothetical protein